MTDVEDALANEDGDHQHYVPQFVLRNFAAGTKKKRKAQVYVFDKHSGTSSLERIKEVAAQPGFYNLPGIPSASADPALTDLENRIAPIVVSIVRSSSIGHLLADHKMALAVFCAAQLIRVPMWREQLRTVNKILRDAVGKMGRNPGEDGLSEMTEHDARAEGVFWLRQVPEFAPYFFEKEWVLLQARAPDLLFISDNPITLDNTTNRKGFYGNLGLGSPGIEIYLPLSSRLVLGMLCPSLRSRGRATLAKMPAKIPPKFKEAAERVREFENAFASGTPLPLSSANVERMNSLQVQASARYVYSAGPNFDLVEIMLRDHPELRYGLRIQRG